MNIIVLIIIIIEVLFFLFSSYYLFNKRYIKDIIKFIMIVFYLIIILILNVNIVVIIKNNINNNKRVNIIDNEDKNISYSINDIYVRLDEIKELIKELENKEQIEELKKEYNMLYEKTKFVISPFPTYNQFPNYPNGCESVALHLLLKYNGVDVNVEEIVEKLKKGDKPYKKNGKLYGGDPLVEFVGDPRSKDGYGVYEEPIIDVSEYYKRGIKNITGSNLNYILDIVSDGNPVQVWVSINLRDTYVCSRWTSNTTGRTVEWLCGLHSLVVIGFTYDKIITSDPYTGEIEYYDRNQFEKIYNIYGKRAIYYEKM